MKALNKRYQVEYFIYTGDIGALEIWLNTNGFTMWGEHIYKNDRSVAKVYDRDITFFNHFVIEDGRIFKMTQEQFGYDYHIINT